MHLLNTAPLILALAALSACGAPRYRVDPAAIEIVREQAMECSSADPAPTWNPEQTILAMRASEGFALYRENAPLDMLTPKLRRSAGGPQWLDGTTLLFGADTNVVPTPSGRWVAAPDGLTTILLTGKRDEKTGNLAKFGYMPRVDDDGWIYLQSEDAIMRVRQGGEPEHVVRGFFPVPQRGGEGLAWNTVPVIEQDLWTGKGATGSLIVRWSPGRTQEFPGVVQPQWMPGRKGLLATRLRQAPQDGVFGLRAIAGTPGDVIAIDGEGSDARVVLANAHSPAMHPTADLIAAIGRSGELILCDLRGDRAATLVAGRASQPSWSHDGRRLAYVRAPEQGPRTPPDAMPEVVVLSLRTRTAEEMAR